jgi:hypothetical protein
MDNFLTIIGTINNKHCLTYIIKNFNILKLNFNIFKLINFILNTNFINIKFVNINFLN